MRTVATLVLLCGAWTAHALPAPAVTAPNGGVLPDLQRLAAGKPLPIIVVSPTERSAVSRAAAPLDFEGKTLLSCLQDIGDTCHWKRGDEAEMPAYAAAFFRSHFPHWIPFKLDSAWTIAPEVRDDLNADVGNVEPLFAMQPWAALGLLVHSLTREQLLKSTTKGLPYADLPAKQQAAMRAAFHGLTGLVNRGSKRSGWIKDFSGHIPVERCTLRLYLSYDNVWWGEGQLASLLGHGIQPIDLTERDGPGGLGLPLKKQVPNALRPQDIAFRVPALQKRIGLKGITTVGKLVTAAAKATGVPLKVVHSWEDRPVFVGDAAMRTCDVLRILAFDLQGAWRKVGRTYLLAWDQTGLGAHNLDLSEKLGQIEEAVNDARTNLTKDDWTESVFTTLGQDPDLPIGPTQEQTAEIRRRAVATHDYRASLSFSELTPEQQNALVAALAGQTRYPDNQPITRDLLATATLGQPSVHASLDVPGVGAVDLGPGGRTRVEFDPMMLPHAEPPPEAAEDNSALQLPPGMHGVAPPPIGRAQWVRLLAQMKRKGLDTLYLPVFWDGQTLFPSKQFPALEVARERDILKEVLVLAKKDRIQVIAVVHALAWRFPESKIHWLTKRRDLVDVDALGRGRWEWASTHDIPRKEDSFGDPSTIIAYDPQLLSDFVRPGDPEVKRRLIGLVAELRAYKDLNGVALAHWSRLAGHCYDIDREFRTPEGPPALGFSQTDRAQFLADTGEDPVDIVDGEPWFEAPYYVTKRYNDDWSKYRFAQDVNLAKAMLDAMQQGWPGHVQTFSYLARLDEGKTPAGDITVRDDGPDASDKALLRRVTVPATLPTANQSEDEAGIRIARLADFVTSIREVAKEADGPARKPPLRGVVLDLTASPDLLWDALALLPNQNRPAVVIPELPR